MRPISNTERLRRRKQRGQAMVETVIVLPVFIFFLLGMIQMTLMHQARLMLEYAAFNAARTGAVWNADPARMRQAALITMLPTRPTLLGFLGGEQRIENTQDLIVEFAKLFIVDMVASEINGFLSEQGLRLGILDIVKVDTLSPTQADFQSGQEELDFDVSSNDFKTRRLGQLTIRVTYFFGLDIPFANWVIFNSWFQARSANSGTANTISGIIEGRGPFIAFDTTGFSAMGRGIQMILDEGQVGSTPYECLSRNDWYALSALPALTNDGYFIPLVTAHTIRMQSNHYKDNLPTADEARCQQQG